jgi:integrase
LLNRFRLTGLPEENARRAIIAPAKLVSYKVKFSTETFTYTDETLGRMVAVARDDEEGSIEPFVLQILCSHIEKQVRNKQIAAKSVRVGPGQENLDKIDTSNEVGLRDRALLGTLAYTFARIGAVVNLKVEDYFQTGKRSMIRFREKGGKETEIPVHHKLEELLDQYLETSGLRNRQTHPSFRLR